jgi:hypothetical protein
MKIYQLVDMTGFVFENNVFLSEEEVNARQIELSDIGFDTIVRIREVVEYRPNTIIDMQEIRSEVEDLKDWGFNELELRKHFHAKYSRTLDIITDIFKG